LSPGKELSRFDASFSCFLVGWRFAPTRRWPISVRCSLAAIVWRIRTTAPPGPAAPHHLVGYLAALLFVGASAVSCVTIVEYWQHAYFTRVRGAALDFWQNLQFVLVAAPLAVFAVVALVRPAWLRGSALFGLLWLAPRCSLSRRGCAPSQRNDLGLPSGAITSPARRPGLCCGRCWRVCGC